MKNYATLLPATFVSTIALISLCGCSAVIAGLFPIQETDTTHRTLEFSGSNERTIDVDNVNGGIHVIGYDGAVVEMSAVRTIRAASPDRAKAARQDVNLEISDKTNVIRIYVDGPFRHGSLDGLGYEVAFDFDLRVPRGVRFELRTVNGPIETEKATGDFDVHTVNGGIAMTDLDGSGSAATVNGGVAAAFIGQVKSASSFKTVNGRVEISFPPNVSADLQLKTVHGGLFTDFPTTVLANNSRAEQQNGRFVYRSDKDARVRIGEGGSVISAEAVNGDLRILRRDP